MARIEWSILWVHHPVSHFVNELHLVGIGAGMGLLSLFLREFLRRGTQRSARRALDKALSEGDPEDVLKQLDDKIRAKLERIAKLEANAGALFGAEVDDLIHQEHRELRDIQHDREIAVEYIEAHR